MARSLSLFTTNVVGYMSLLLLIGNVLNTGSGYLINQAVRTIDLLMMFLRSTPQVISRCTTGEHHIT